MNMVKCIVCGKELKNLQDNEIVQPYDGVAFHTYGHYGSTVFDPCGGPGIEIVVCDQCLMDKLNDSVYGAGKENIGR
ncbi:MAG: hypothetical protein WCY93_08655 [Anaerolineaceae bacterium]